MTDTDQATDPIMLNERQASVLDSTFIGILSTVRHSDGRISSNPVSFIWNGVEVEISTLKSRMKYRNLVANPAATFCVVSPEDHMRYVEIRGTARLVDDPDKSYLRSAFRQLTGEDPPQDMDPPGAQRVTIYIRPEQVSSPAMYGGRFENKPD